MDNFSNISDSISTRSDESSSVPGGSSSGFGRFVGIRTEGRTAGAFAGRDIGRVVYNYYDFRTCCCACQSRPCPPRPHPCGPIPGTPQRARPPWTPESQPEQPAATPPQPRSPTRESPVTRGEDAVFKRPWPKRQTRGGVFTNRNDGAIKRPWPERSALNPSTKRKASATEFTNSAESENWRDPHGFFKKTKTSWG